ncbi:hypothetical protein BBIA_1966 [Bifidobacterium biavatii DSM 23969]|uniref:Uncharacterized protein n=1 Tax=Bifidobacterium biavatii DSM 23969 TaxID=1437608 RepID=A0A086ZR17_9BIFI|nr:hypothetical protein BBIA_1966 [Bifidobacterium biavatii DSM 23969]
MPYAPGNETRYHAVARCGASGGFPAGHETADPVPQTPCTGSDDRQRPLPPIRNGARLILE